MSIFIALAIGAVIASIMTARITDKQIADRDARVAALYTEAHSIERQAEEWQAKAAKLQADLDRQVRLRINLDDALEAAHARALEAHRDAVKAGQEAHKDRVRADRAEAALRAIAEAVGAPPAHPDVGEKILERLAVERPQMRRLGGSR